MNYAIILASGSGSRINKDKPKQFFEINGKTVLEYTICAFEKNEMTDRIILVVHESYIEFCSNFKFKKLYKITKGGLTRQESSFAGVDLIVEDNAKVLIHDGARPFVKNEIINNCYKALDNFEAVNTGIETSDTIMEVKNNIISDIPKRETLLRAQTPQGFKSGLIKTAHKLAKEQNIKVTDDAGLVVSLNLAPVYVVLGDIENIKITYPDDLKKAIEKLRQN